MKISDVREVIYEALVMYIDDLSMIEYVRTPPNENKTDDSELEVKLKNGEEYRLVIIPLHRT